MFLNYPFFFTSLPFISFLPFSWRTGLYLLSRIRIATECPTCHSGLEMHQIRAEINFDIKTDVKILYFTQLLGLALGLKPRKLGIHENISDSHDLLKGAGLI